jgi:hypothetical protein
MFRAAVDSLSTRIEKKEIMTHGMPFHRRYPGCENEQYKPDKLTDHGHGDMRLLLHHLPASIFKGN